MEFMNLFTGKKTQETESTRNAACHADQPNEECSSIEKIRKLQDEIESLQRKKEELDCKSAYDIIHDINNSDSNILEKYSYPYLYLNDYNGTKEVEKLWINFIELFNCMKDESKDEIINYLKSLKDIKQIIANYNSRINVLETQVKLEKQKLGIK